MDVDPQARRSCRNRRRRSTYSCRSSARSAGGPAPARRRRRSTRAPEAKEIRGGRDCLRGRAPPDRARRPPRSRSAARRRAAPCPPPRSCRRAARARRIRRAVSRARGCGRAAAAARPPGARETPAVRRRRRRRRRRAPAAGRRPPPSASGGPPRSAPRPAARPASGGRAARAPGRHRRPPAAARGSRAPQQPGPAPRRRSTARQERQRRSRPARGRSSITLQVALEQRAEQVGHQSRAGRRISASTDGELIEDRTPARRPDRRRRLPSFPCSVLSHRRHQRDIGEPRRRRSRSPAAGARPAAAGQTIRCSYEIEPRLVGLRPASRQVADPEPRRQRHDLPPGQLPSRFRRRCGQAAHERACARRTWRGRRPRNGSGCPGRAAPSVVTVERVRDERDGEALAVARGHGQADAVESDRALLDHVGLHARAGSRP